MKVLRWSLIVCVLLGHRFLTGLAARSPTWHSSINRIGEGTLAARQQSLNLAWISMAFPLNRVDGLKDLYRIYTLAKSIRKHSDYPFVVLTNLETLEPTDSFHNDMQHLGVQFQRMVHLNISDKLKSQLGRMPSWQGAYQKLQVFNLTQYDRLIWLDSDSMLTKHADYLFQLQGYWSQSDWCSDEGNQHNLSVNSGALVIKPSVEHFEGLLAKGEEIAAQGKLKSGDQQVIESYFKDIGQPVQLLSQEHDAAMGRCWNAASGKPMPGFVHKPWGLKDCLDALAEIAKEGHTTKMPACTRTVLGCRYRDSICDAEISNDTAVETFCISNQSNCTARE